MNRNAPKVLVRVVCTIGMALGALAIGALAIGKAIGQFTLVRAKVRGAYVDHLEIARTR